VTLTQLEYVLAINQYRHFAKAAKACHVAQPTLSLQLQKLEMSLDVIIFDRSKNPIIPTKTGEALIKQASVVLKEARLFEKIAKEKKDELSGPFKLSVIPTLAPYVIPLFLEKFSEKYPKVEVHISENETKEIIELLENDKIDAGLLVTPLGKDSFIERVLFYEPFYLYTSTSHPYYKLQKVKEQNIKDPNLWVLQDGHCFRNQVLNICQISKLQKDTNKRIHFESGSLETIKKLVNYGSGYTLLPYLSTLDISEQRKGQLKEFLSPVPTREVSLVHSRTFLKEPIIDALEKDIINFLPKEITSRKRDINIIGINNE